MKKIFILSIFIFISTFGFSQEEITVMQYNLLGYASDGYITCNASNNNIDKKDSYIKTIVQYVKPDIFTVNEISSKTADHDRIKDNCLNVDGITTYKRGNITNYSNSETVNQLYYNSSKFSIASADAISNSLRDINIYKLKFYKNDANGNRIFLHCIVAHLKAGSYPENEIERATMTASIMSYLSGNLNTGENVLVMGDFNLYSGYEEAYQNMISNENANIKLYDPAGQFGDWGNNSAFKLYHTQSTHTSSNGCVATGGFDDRFDFILATNSIISGTKKITYIQDSYVAVGQDGTRYNSSLNTTSNEVVPNYVAEALYNNSDHLPVSLKLNIAGTTAGIEDFSELNGIDVRFQNPTSKNLKLFIENSQNYKGELRIELYSIIGQNIASKKINILQGSNQLEFDLNNYKPGVYIIKFTDKDLNIQSKRLVIE